MLIFFKLSARVTLYLCSRSVLISFSHKFCILILFIYALKKQCYGFDNVRTVKKKFIFWFQIYLSKPFTFLSKHFLYWVSTTSFRFTNFIYIGNLTISALVGIRFLLTFLYIIFLIYGISKASKISLDMTVLKP